MQVKKQQLELHMEQQTGSKLGNEYDKFFVILYMSPCLFNLYAADIIRNAGLEEAQAGSRLSGEISITSDMLMTPPLWQKVKN